MNYIKIPMNLLSLIFLLTTQAHAKLTVHEWGTFTSLVGSNGQAQNGMYYEDEALPDFVHNFGDPKNSLQNAGMNLFAWAPPQDPPPPPSRCPGHPKVPCEYLFGQMITQKMETPVVYFYSDRSQKVDFNVSFPGGIISQSYPATSYSLPEAIPGVEMKNGFAHYEVNILKDVTTAPPFVDPSNIYSHARNVASDLIQVGQETEKFIFYRGLGEFKTKLLTTSKNGSLRIQNNGTDRIPAVFLVYTDGQKHGDIISLGKIDSRDNVVVSSRAIAKLQSTEQPLSTFLTAARQRLLQSLTKAGLFADEAQSMIDTWESGYFKTPGLRILYVLSRQEVEEILPVQVSPQPDELNRVFIGRIEILLDTVEEQVLAQVIVQADQYDVLQLGRMAQPILLRVQEMARLKGILTAELSATIDSLISQIP